MKRDHGEEKERREEREAENQSPAPLRIHAGV